MTTPITITFPLKLFNPEMFGISSDQAASNPDLLAEHVAGMLGELFQTLGQNARITATQ